MFREFWAEFLSCFFVLFAMMGVLVNLPFVLQLQREGKEISPLKALFFGLFLLVGFFYLGEVFLRLFGVDFSSFAVAGSIVIFAIGLEMIMDLHIFTKTNTISNDVTLMPVMFPMMIGAGTFTAILSLRSSFHDENVLLAILANLLIIYSVLKMSKKLEHFLSPVFLYILKKLFGVLLLAMAIKIFSSNVMILF